MSYSFIDRSSNYFTQNYDNEETQKKIDPIAQLKEINNTTVREWGLFNNHPAQMFAKEEDLSEGVKEEGDIPILMKYDEAYNESNEEPIQDNIDSWENENKKVYIFYSDDFKSQAQVHRDNSIKSYGENSVAMTNLVTSNKFKEDWSMMKGDSIVEVNINAHGQNQSMTTRDGDPLQQVTSTGNGRTNGSSNNGTGNPALNVQDLPNPEGNLNKAQLNLNTCHSNDTNPDAHDGQNALKGSKLTLAQAFRNSFSFSVVRGTAGGVSYNNWFHFGKPYLEPYPNNGKWDYLRPLIDSPIQKQESNENKIEKA